MIVWYNDGLRQEVRREDLASCCIGSRTWRKIMREQKRSSVKATETDVRSAHIIFLVDISLSQESSTTWPVEVVDESSPIRWSTL